MRQPISVLQLDDLSILPGCVSFGVDINPIANCIE